MILSKLVLNTFIFYSLIFRNLQQAVSSLTQDTSLLRDSFDDKISQQVKELEKQLNSKANIKIV